MSSSRPDSISAELLATAIGGHSPGQLEYKDQLHIDAMVALNKFHFIRGTMSAAYGMHRTPF